MDINIKLPTIICVIGATSTSDVSKSQTEAEEKKMLKFC